MTSGRAAPVAAHADVSMEVAGMEGGSLSGARCPFEGSRRLVHTLERSLKPQVQLNTKRKGKKNSLGWTRADHMK